VRKLAHPEMAKRLYILFALATSSRLVLFTQMVVLTWFSVSPIVTDALACRNDIPDSSLVMSILFPLFVNFLYRLESNQAISSSPVKNIMYTFLGYWYHVEN
jgi:hypothetical protein